MIIIGIDPGQTGAIAAMENGELVGLHDMPTSSRIHGKGQQVNPSELASILMEMRDARPAVVFLETVAAMPGQGVSSTFHFGESVGIVLGVCGALGLQVRRVRPQYWKKKAGIIGKDKDTARTLAIQSHPDFSDMLKLKKHHNRAEAILIAQFGE
jgi:crossover junction endodeoxyribonuclease RuvC